MKSCQANTTGTGFSFIDVNPMSPFEYRILKEMDSLDKLVWNYVTAKTTSLKGLVFQNGRYERLFNSEIRGTVKFKVLLSDIMTEEDLIDLEAGSIVETDFDFMLQRKIIFNNKITPLKTFETLKRYGLFRFILSVEKEDDTTYKLNML
jgi:hypothetical protein